MRNYFISFEKFLNISEKMAVKRDTVDSFVSDVVRAYDEAPVFDKDAVPAWKSLNRSNYLLFKRLLSKIDIVFTTENKPLDEEIIIDGRSYPVIEQKDGYETQEEMKRDVQMNNRLYVSIDHSEHPIFSVVDNIVFRTVHDYIVHILGDKPFGLFGELQAYNLHAKLVPVDARPAIFTEVVGQISWYHIHNEFPVQKVAILKGFDWVNVGL